MPFFLAPNIFTDITLGALCRFLLSFSLRSVMRSGSRLIVLVRILYLLHIGPSFGLF